MEEGLQLLSDGSIKVRDLALGAAGLIVALKYGADFILQLIDRTNTKKATGSVTGSMQDPLGLQASRENKRLMTELLAIAERQEERVAGEAGIEDRQDRILSFLKEIRARGEDLEGLDKQLESVLLIVEKLQKMAGGDNGEFTNRKIVSFLKELKPVTEKCARQVDALYDWHNVVDPTEPGARIWWITGTLKNAIGRIETMLLQLVNRSPRSRDRRDDEG